MSKVSFLGAGSWGTALAIMLAKNGHSVTLWSAVDAEVKMLSEYREHKDRLPGVRLPGTVIVTDNLEDACKGYDLIVFSVASPYVRDTARKAAAFLPDGQLVVNVAKGIEDSTFKTLRDIICEEIPNADVSVLSGPSHAEEVAIGIPTALVVASKEKEVKEKVVDVFKSNHVRMYHTSDVKGVELGGALKNIIAFCAGAAVGLGLGDNTFAMLATRGLVEITRLGVAMGGDDKTFYGLTGLGDLIVTCGSQHSRNRKAGELIAKGYSMEETKKQIGMTIESIDNIDAAYHLAQKYQVEMPIVETVYEVLYHGLNPKQAVEILMTRELKAE